MRGSLLATAVMLSAIQSLSQPSDHEQQREARRRADLEKEADEAEGARRRTAAQAKRERKAAKRRNKEG